MTRHPDYQTEQAWGAWQDAKQKLDTARRNILDLETAHDDAFTDYLKAHADAMSRNHNHILNTRFR